MRPTFSSTISVLSLSLLTLLSACGGGGSDKAPTTPVGQLTLTGTAAGTYMFNLPDPTTQSGTDVTVLLKDAATSYFGFVFDVGTSAVEIIDAEIKISGTSYFFRCGTSGAPACGTAGGTATVSPTARTLTFTNYSVPSHPVGTTTVINGTVTWPAP